MDPGGELTVRVADLPEGGRTHASRRGDGQGTWHRRPAEDRTPQLVLSRAKATNGDISISLTKGRLN
jgi:hypothetical protein